MENQRPRLSDPAEFAIVKQMYFNNDRLINENLDPIERLERSEAKSRHNNKSSR